MERITAKKEGDGIVLEMYDLPMPPINHKNDLEKYESSKKTVRVHPDSQQGIEDYLRNILYQRSNGYFEKDFYSLIENISLNELKDRIEIKKAGEFIDGDYHHFNCNTCLSPFNGHKRQLNCKICCEKEYVILKPIPLPMEESQEEMINEIIKIYTDLKDKYNPMNYWSDTLEVIHIKIKEKFTLIKNK